MSKVEQAIAAAWPLSSWCDVNVIVAVSGGRDSVVLLHALHSLKKSGEGQLHVAHFNHELRGEHSDGDEHFVRDLADQLGLPSHVSRTAVQSTGDGLEAAARSARYEFLKQTAQHCGVRYVATGHNSDDQVETILHRILRGTGIVGLAGMSRARPLDDGVTLIRPLLQISRAEIDQYVAANSIRFREDASNKDAVFTRNRLRHDLLPVLRSDYNANVDEALLRLSELATENQAVIAEVVVGLYTQCCTVVDEDAIRIDCKQLGCRSQYVIRELMMHIWRTHRFQQQAMGKAQWDMLAEMVHTTSAAHDLPCGLRAEKNGDSLTLLRTS